MMAGLYTVGRWDRDGDGEYMGSFDNLTAARMRALSLTQIEEHSADAVRTFIPTEPLLDPFVEGWDVAGVLIGICGREDE